MNTTVNTTNKNNGFAKIIVIVIVLGLVFTLSGFNVRDGVNPERLQSKISQMKAKVVDLYKAHAQSTVSTYIIEPGRSLGTVINTYIISTIKNTLQHIIDTPPAMKNISNLDSLKRALDKRLSLITTK